ncbi:hypothetical protein, conserved [Eimeria maxima]|uniref:Uncharacterized protein n=1 Tax=Eimeria maxima TaxID=5804 RepID=U6MA17_EIMMA|nr:hypothetical protein, conserved [Eimeria maxima]CDJ60886.1 hypothetical protein, conserved [Eimeria maxima]
MARNGTSLYQAYNPYDSRNIVPSYPGGSSSGQPQSSESVNSPVVPEGGRQSFSRHSTSPGGANSSVPNSQSNGGVPTNGFSGLRPMANRPSELNIRYPGSRYTQSGRTTSSFMGIASGDPYSSYSRYGQGSQMANQPAGDVPESSSTSSTSEEEPQPAETEDESAEAETSGRLGERRVMNPYDLSHIFPDIYQDQQPASYENMTNQSLALLEMTTINSDPEGE